MSLCTYGMDVSHYHLKDKRIEVTVQFWKEFLGICTGTAYGFFTGHILDDGEVVWTESGRTVNDAIEAKLDAVYRKAKKHLRLKQEQSK